jgi:hypothetical protein
MDLLPYPADPSQPPLQFEFICGELLKEQKVAQFFENFTWEAWEQEVEVCKTMLLDEEGAKHIQAYVYFGHLRGIVGSSFNPADFLRDGKFITLARLRDYLPGVEEKSRYIQNLYVFTGSIPTDLCLSASPASTIEVLISLNVLDYSTWVANATPLRFFPPRTSAIAAPLLKERIIRSGWCPYWTNLWINRFSIPFLHYLGGLKCSVSGDPRNKGKSIACTVEQCYCNNIDTKTYQPQHSSSCESLQCQFTGVNANHLSEMINEGKVPLIKLSRRPAPTDISLEDRLLDRAPQNLHLENATWVSDGYIYDFDIVTFDLGIRFVAISHVWSGGLGNFTANTVPRCQLEYLYQEVDECRQRNFDESRMRGGHRSWEYVADDPLGELISLLKLSSIRNFLQAAKDEPVYIWLDAICIPFDNGTSERRKTKQIAIDTMRFVYGSAAHVLVIDPVVRESSFDQETEYNIAVKIATSSWLTRVWTFQEGFLARELSFSTKDKCINPKKSTFTIEWRLRGNGLSAAANVRFDYTWSRCETKEELALAMEALDSISKTPEVTNELSLSAGREDDWIEDLAISAATGGRVAWSYIKSTFLRGKEHDPSACPIEDYDDDDEEIKVFCNLWNEMSERKTSMSADIRGILAIGMGLRPGEIVSLAEHERRHDFREMKTLMRGIPRLPFDMLVKPFPSASELCPNERWIPSIPTGNLYHDPSMAWVEDGSGLCLPPSCPAYFFVDDNLALRPDENFNIEVENSKVVWIKLLGIPEDFEFGGEIFCVILTNRQDRDTGALFIVRRWTTSAVFLQFCCPLIHGPLSEYVTPLISASPPPVGTRCILSCGKRPAFQETALNSELMFVMATDPQEWPSPKHTVKLSRFSQIYFTAITPPFLVIYWYIRSWNIIFQSVDTWKAMNICINNYIENHFEQFLPGLIRTVLHIFRIITFLIIVCVILFGPIFLRLIVFFIFEGPSTDYRITEARRRRFAEISIDNRSKQSKSRFSFACTRFRLYQYPSLISVAPPLAVAGLLYGIGSWLVARGPHGNILLQICFYLLGWPNKSMGVTLLLEFPLRVAAELLCRFPWMKVISFVAWKRIS